MASITEPTNRRSLLSVFASAAAVAAVPAAAAAMPSADSVFEVIEAHRAADAALRAANREFRIAYFKHAPESIPAAIDQLLGDADTAERAAMRSLVETTPTTMESAAALTAYLSELLWKRRSW